MLPGTSPGGVNVWSAVRSALVSWYSEITGSKGGETQREKEMREGGGEERWGFYIIQLSGASILTRANPY